MAPKDDQGPGLYPRPRPEPLRPPRCPPAGSMPRPGWAAARAAVLIMPLLLFVALRFPLYSMNHFQDAVFLHGILDDPAEHLRRFGATYYNVRFGAILPEAALWRLLGPEAGYAAFRWAAAGLGALALFEGVRTWRGPALGLFAATAYLVSPIAARMFLQTYVDIAAVSYTLGAVVLLLFGTVRSRPAGRLAAGFWAGVLAGLAVNSNFFAVMPLAATAPALVVLHGRKILRLGVPTAAAAVGFAVVCAAGFAFYRWHYGVPNVFAPTIAAVLTLTGGSSAIWAEKTHQWILDWPFVPVPFLLCLPGLVLARAGDRLGAALVCYAASCAALFVAYVAFGQGYSLKLYWYYSFLLPGMTLATTAAAAAAVGLFPPDRRRLAAFVATGALMALADANAASALPVLEWRLPTTLAVAASAAVGLELVRRWAWPEAVLAGILGVFGVATMLLMAKVDYRTIYMTQYSEDWDVFEGIESFVHHMPRTDVDPGDVRFLASAQLVLRETLLQSSFLGPWTGLLGSDRQPLTLDSRSPEILRQLCDYKTRFLITLDHDAAETDGFTAWLARQQVVLAPFRRFSVPLRDGRVDVAVFRVEALPEAAACAAAAAGPGGYAPCCRKGHPGSSRSLGAPVFRGAFPFGSYFD